MNAGTPRDLLKTLVISPELLLAIAEIDEFKGRWQALGTLAPDRLAAMRRIATIESVGSSTRIEGAKLSDQEVDRLLSGLDVRSFRSRDEQEVAGYAEAMELLFEAWRDMSLTENHIKQLHGTLLRYSDKDEHHRGNYKTVTNHVEAFDAEGKSLGVIFQTASPFDTPRLMETLVRWTDDALKVVTYHPLLVIGVFVVRFLAVHPFQDGNGRLARVLTNLLLLRAGYTYVPYSSLERVIEENKDDYYRSLRRAQATLDRDESQLVEWLLFFLRCLIKQKDVLARKAERESIMAPLSPLGERLIELAREHGRLTLAAAEKLTHANRNTLKAHLRRLVEAGRLRLLGRGRASWYELG
ncbi:MAG: Fic family protein [Myxococcaceae bacterium]|nr:Fic family protein [Myxococcaceae bacterium]